MLVYANCDDAYYGKFLGFWSFDCQERIRQATGDPPGDESQAAKYWRDVGVEYAKDHVGRLPVVVAARVGRQWDVFRPWQNAEFAPIEGRDKNGARLGLITYYALVAAGINGVRVLWRRRITLLPLGAQIASVTITSAFAYGTVRFRAPAEPVLCLLAAVGIAPLLTRARRRVLTDEEPPIDDPRAYVLGAPAIPARSTWRRRWSWAGFTAAITVAALTLLPVRGMFRSTGGTMEEGFMLAFPERMLKGDVPNVDFLHLYGPGALDSWRSGTGFRRDARGRAHVRPAATHRHHLCVVGARPRLGSRRRVRHGRAVGVPGHDADRADRDGMERRRRARPVERGLRRAIAHGDRAPHRRLDARVGRAPRRVWR